MPACRNCGTEHEIGAAFCGNCGSKIEYVENTQSVPESGKKMNTSVLVAMIVSIAAVIIVAVLVFGKGLSFGIGGGGEEPKDDIIPIDDGGIAVDEEKENVIPEPPVPDKKAEIDMNRISSIIASDKKGARISVCVIDLETGATYETNNAHSKMSASALVNVPVLYTISRCLANNYNTWDTGVIFRYMYGGRGSIKQNQSGNVFTLSYLVSQMLKYSDNNVTNSFMDHYTRDYIDEVCAHYGYNSVDLQRYLGESSASRDNYISASDAAHMLAEMYRGEAGHGITGQYLRSNFIINDNNRWKGIGSGIPSNVTFLNHNGVTSSIYNEAGIIATGNAEYVLVVLCNGGTMESSANTVGAISSYVYGVLNQ